MGDAVSGRGCTVVSGEKPKWWEYRYSTTGSHFTVARGSCSTLVSAQKKTIDDIERQIMGFLGHQYEKKGDYAKYYHLFEQVISNESACRRGDNIYGVVMYVEIRGYNTKPMDITKIIRKMEKDLGADIIKPFVPGWAQIHKGSALKGGIFITLEAVCVGGIIVTESMRSSYVSKANDANSSQLRMEYRSDTDNMANIRNAVIAGAAAVYIWNVIDGFAAKNLAQSRAGSASNSDLQITPYATLWSGGLNFTLNF
jgi:hypothetical protein